jgi:hypothetical protein
VVVPSLVAALAIGVGLWAIRATATGNCLDDFDHFAGTGVLDKVPDVDDTIVAGVGALVLAVGVWCCREGIAGWRYSVLAAHGATPPE